MPRTWHDKHTVNKIEDENTKNFYRSIVADKKPYFMRYIYPALMKQYNTYIKNTNRNALREFQMTVDEIMATAPKKLNNKQKDFLTYYNYYMPVGTSDCVMNKICKRFEAEFDGYIKKHNVSTRFDYTIMKSKAEYSTSQFRAIKRLYEEYNDRLQNYVALSTYERVDKHDVSFEINIMNEDFRKECSFVCSNAELLCNIILDICYTRNRTKKFAWGICNHSIIQNLLNKNERVLLFPVFDSTGDIEYCGKRYTMKSRKVEVSD